jgi:hypothetical protein
MPPVNRVSVAEATPQTIWKTCFEPMKWESWDPDVKELKDVSGPCMNGTTMNFVMVTGPSPMCTLSNVVENSALTFSGKMAGGAVKFAGTILLTPEPDDSGKTTVDYTFEISGCVGAIASRFKSKDIIGGTESGLANIVRLSEEAQRSE